MNPLLQSLKTAFVDPFKKVLPPMSTPTVPNMSMSTNKPVAPTYPTPTGAPVTPKVAPAPTSGAYSIAKGDTLTGIAAKNGLTLDSLLSMNPQYKANPNAIQIGGTVNLKAPTATPVVPPVVKSSTSTTPPLPTVPMTTTDGQNINPATGGVTMTPVPPPTDITTPPVAPVAPATDPYKDAVASAEKTYAGSNTPTQDEIDTQAKLDELTASTRLGEAGMEGQGRAIPLALIRGDQARMEKQSLLLAEPLQTKLARLQAQRTSAVEASKFALDRADKALDANKTPKPASAQEYEYAKKNGYTGTFTEYQNEDANRKATASGIGSDAQSVAEGIMSGLIPPDLTKNVSFKDRTAVNALLSKKGYNLTQATEDWTATQKYLATLNGAQQTRLRQAVNFSYDSLDLVDTLNTDLSNNLSRVGITAINRKNMDAAKQGIYGNDAKQAAVKLDSQISDLISELATVYKGGNGSTDESLKLAAEQLNSAWDEKTLTSAIDLVRKNLAIRKNSINVGVAGINDSKYAPAGSSTSDTSGSGAGGGTVTWGDL